MAEILAQSTGRRKESVARVRLRPGNGVHTVNGRNLDQYFARCHALTRPGGRLIFESHPPELEGNAFGGTLKILERYYTIDRIEMPDYGTFLDKGRRFLVATRR